ncbi:hypothetical protein U0070_004855 [Myodes glareolus]|uniref:Uncharacterized protein n=1 Tax=Myodes glareolus TaxID=447135 RepID=A0AAW0J6B0_MYOGA
MNQQRKQQEKVLQVDCPVQSSSDKCLWKFPTAGDGKMVADLLKSRHPQVLNMYYAQHPEARCRESMKRPIQDL